MAAELPELAHWLGLSSFRACLLLLFCPSHRFLPDQEFEVLFVVCSSKKGIFDFRLVRSVTSTEFDD